MMNKYFVVMLFCFLTNLTLYSQNCLTEKGEYFFVEIDIRGANSYPIIMTGLTSSLEIGKYIKNTPETFLQSFYTLGKYIPYISFFWDLLPLECQSKDYDRKAMIILSKKLLRKSLKRHVFLKTGETVFLRISKIQAELLIIDKDSKIIPTNSNELALSEFDEIRKCYIPLKIYLSKRPQRKEIR